MQIRRRFL